MAKLPLLALIALTALVSLSVVSAYKTTITTTTIEEDDFIISSDEQKCSSPAPVENLEKCVDYLTQGLVSGKKLLRMVVNGSPILECCSELVSLSPRACQCNGVQQAFDEARAKASNIIEVRQMLTRAQVLAPYCRLGASCPIVSPRA